MARKGYQEHYSGKEGRSYQIGCALIIAFIFALPFLFSAVTELFFGGLAHHTLGRNLSILLYLFTLILVLLRM